ncbi:anaphase promoting complex subunit 5 [Scheffersomyces spartinae]|uniref:Anaphase-promoting complex subunit 5 n=1 Tax=Scheffersomyces spartinae TaxID=45513 RepID=A0A9P7V867_9ASCO|nr:anaphase promoting complex subunit 5 [Scheffersomyces spartinae]KAG7192947.1 anaphase promoting complex subunit 5 [Scheffersomyces spartinae]
MDSSIELMLLRRMWCIKVIDDVDTLMQSLVQKVSTKEVKEEESKEIYVSPKSLLGQMIQRVVTDYNILLFEESLILFEAFLEYRSPTKEYYISIEDPDHLEASAINLSKTSETVSKDERLFNDLNTQLQDILGISINTILEGTELPSTLKRNLICVPKNDLQGLINKQISLLETYGTPTPPRLRAIMTLMASPSSNTSSIGNIGYNNYPSYYFLKYLENLKESNYTGAFDSLYQYFDYMVSTNSKYFYHFALIARASFHQYFGEDMKVLEAIEEAISVARENKDNSTLTYIISFLFNFMMNRPNLWKKQSFYNNNNNEGQLLEFLVKKSLTISSHMQALSYQFEVLHQLNNGGVMSKYLESLLKAGYVSIHENKATFIKSLEIASTMWNRICVPELSDVYGTLAMSLCEKWEDKISLKMRNYHLQMQRGNVDHALRDLEALKLEVGNRDISLRDSIEVRRLIMEIRSNLMKGRVHYSKQLLDTINKYYNPKELDLVNEILLLTIEVNIYSENYTQALKLIVEKVNDDFNNIPSLNTYSMSRLNIMKCRIYFTTGNGSKVLRLVILQIQQTQKYGYTYLFLECVLLLIGILYEMNQLEECTSVLNDVMPLVLSSESNVLISRCYYLLARVAGANYMATGDTYWLTKTLKYLNGSILGYKELGDVNSLAECFNLQLEIAQHRQDSILVEHARESLTKVDLRTEQASSLGFI